MAYIPIDDDVFQRAMNDEQIGSDFDAAGKNAIENLPKGKTLLPDATNE